MKSSTYSLEESDEDRWWFRDQHLMKEPRTLGRVEKMNQEGRWPGAFSTTPSARRNLYHLGERNKLREVNIKTSEL